LPEELRKRQHRIDSSETKFNKKRSAFNQKMGSLIRERLKWIMLRRKSRCVVEHSRTPHDVCGLPHMQHAGDMDIWC